MCDRKTSPHSILSSLLLKRCLVTNFSVSRPFLPALFDNDEFFAREAVKGINELVNLGLQGRNIGVRVSFLGSEALVRQPDNRILSVNICFSNRKFLHENSTWFVEAVL